MNFVRKAIDSIICIFYRIVLTCLEKYRRRNDKTEEVEYHCLITRELWNVFQEVWRKRNLDKYKTDFPYVCKNLKVDKLENKWLISLDSKTDSYGPVVTLNEYMRIYKVNSPMIRIKDTVCHFFGRMFIVQAEEFFRETGLVKRTFYIIEFKK